MIPEVVTPKIKNQFRFEGVENETELARKANLRLIQLLAYAQPGAVATGLVQKSGKSFLASITIWSPYRSFTASSVALSAEAAVNLVLSKMDDQLFNWRYGSGNGRSSPQSSVAHMGDRRLWLRGDDVCYRLDNLLERETIEKVGQRWRL